MGNISDWEKVRPEPLGKGGQSTVFLVRRPERRANREKSIDTIKRLSGRGLGEQTALEFARASADVARDELPSELAALKIFNPRAAGPVADQQAAARMQNEIAVLKEGRPGLLKLLDYSEQESWIVSEYCHRGTLADNLHRYKGNVKLAFKSFLSLLQTVSELHKDKIVHRDIKPQNIFIGEADELLLGDFGIVFLPNQPERVSFTGESVGPRDFMPPWVFLDEQPGPINPTFDVYMLGKVLWCMVSGRLKLHREDFREPPLNVVEMFPEVPEIHHVNTILEKCVVAREKDCLKLAGGDLLLMVRTLSQMMELGGEVLKDGTPALCRVCRLGQYQPVHNTGTRATLPMYEWKNNASYQTEAFRIRAFACDRCGHVEFFK